MKSMRRMATTLLVVAFLFCARTLQAQVLDQVPEQALVVVKVTNVGAVSTKLGKLFTDLQLTVQVPPLADPLGALQDKLKIKEGTDKSGDAVFAYIDPSVAGGDQENSVLLLWPVSDYKAFVGNFEGGKPDGVSEVKFSDSDKPAYVVSWGKYAAITPSKEIAALKPEGIKVNGATAKEMGKDLCLLANMPKLKTMVQPEIAKAKDEALDNIDKQMAGDVAKFAPTVKVLLGQVFAVADSFFRDAQSATVSLNLGENGISTTVMAEFEPGSYIGGLATSLKNSDASMLTGLPAGKYLFYGGSVNDPAVAGKLLDDLLNPITAELSKVSGPEGEAVNKYVAAFRKFVAATKSSSFGLIAPTGALGQEPIIQMVGIQVGDAVTLKQSYQDIMTSQQEMMKAFGMPQDMVKTTTTPNAKTLEGVSFDQTHTDMNMGAGANAAQMDNAMKMIYGPEGANALTGVVGTDKLLIGFGASDAVLTSTIQAIKAGDDPLGKSASVVAVTAQLPKSRVMSMYVPVDEIVSTIGTYAGAMGMPIQIQLPPDLPPIGITAGTDGSAVRIDSYTPTDLIKALVAQGMQLYMQRMGGGTPGGPGGL